MVSFPVWLSTHVYLSERYIIFLLIIIVSYFFHPTLCFSVLGPVQRCNSILWADAEFSRHHTSLILPQKPLSLFATKQCHDEMACHTSPPEL